MVEHHVKHKPYVPIKDPPAEA
ncbi:uncharacterized protein G2W53_010353 [Senna tora]|uniref:Uncharacterized protein n=1 Tax=Senna tora TaxID=362788 RepID=A0A834WZR1_9FABA|nr:uncharacterized protein G2W53_010353 [Senna tora]